MDNENKIISNNETHIIEENDSLKDNNVEAHSSSDENDINNYMSISDDNDEIEINSDDYNLLSIYEGVTNNFTKLNIDDEKANNPVIKVKTKGKVMTVKKKKYILKKRKMIILKWKNAILL